MLSGTCFTSRYTVTGRGLPDAVKLMDAAERPGCVMAPSCTETVRVVGAERGAAAEELGDTDSQLGVCWGYVMRVLNETLPADVLIGRLWLGGPGALTSAAKTILVWLITRTLAGVEL